MALACFIGSCKNTHTTFVVCNSNQDCSEGFWCHYDAQQCRCSSDQACQSLHGQKARCNKYGFCQMQSHCQQNTHCLLGNHFCDQASGLCLEQSACTADHHCSLGSYCEQTSALCKTGCRHNGDCLLGEYCDVYNGQGSCQTKDCHSCSTTTDCAYGSRCDQLQGRCQPPQQPSGPCMDCSTDRCPLGYRCTLDENNQHYCAPLGCQTDASCPHGFSRCSSVPYSLNHCMTDNACREGFACLQGIQHYVGCGCYSDRDCGQLGRCTSENHCLLDDSINCSDDLDCNLRCYPLDPKVNALHQLPAGLGYCGLELSFCAKDKDLSCEQITQNADAPCSITE